PRITAEPIRSEKEAGLFFLERCRQFPGLTRIFRDADSFFPRHGHFLLVATEKRALPDADFGSLLFPIRAEIIANEEPIGRPQVMRAAEEHRYPGLRIRSRNLLPVAAEIDAAVDAVSVAIDEGL